MKRFSLLIWLLLTFFPAAAQEQIPIAEYGRGWPEVVVWNDAGDGFYVKTRDNTVWEYDLITLTGTLSDRVVDEYGLVWGDSEQIMRVEWPSSTGHLTAVTYWNSDAVIDIFGADETEPRATLDGFHRERGLRSVAWSPDDHYLAGWDSYGLILVWDARTYTQIGRITDHLIQSNIAFSADSRMVAVADVLGTIRVFDTETGALLHTLEGLETSVRDLLWQPGGTLLAARTGGIAVTRRYFPYEYVALIWDAVTGETVGQISLPYPVNSLVWHPDGAYLVAATPLQILIWDAQIRSFTDLDTTAVRWTFLTEIYFDSAGTLLMASIYNCSHGPHGLVYVWDAGTFGFLKAYDCVEPLAPEHQRIYPPRIEAGQPNYSPDGRFRAESQPRIWVFRLYRDGE